MGFAIMAGISDAPHALITSELGRPTPRVPGASMNRHELARAIYYTAHLTGTFRLRSGAKSSEYFDKGSKHEEPRWLMVDVKWEADFKTYVTLDTLRADAKLADLLILRRGNRLSITPVEQKHWDRICKLGGL